MEDFKNYIKIQDFVRKEAEDVANKVYDDKATKWGVAEVPTHVHNGVDSNQISESDLIKSNRNITGFAVDSNGGATASTTTLITGINTANIGRVVFSGFAANNSDGTPATKRLLTQGEAQFGRCYEMSGATGTVLVLTPTMGQNIVQISNAMFVDSTDLTKNKVFATPATIAYGEDDTGEIVASLAIDSITTQSMTVSSTIGRNWKLQGNIILS